jgi:ubiquinone/menaquinone biosynthesis C-methylase UbiE
VLEIGFGTGANLQYYPPEVRRLETLDPDPALARLAERRIAAAGWAGPDRQIVTHRLSAETLPFGAGEFDTVVSTFTLCSIPDVAAALREVRRVLRPGGAFLFLEHGRAPDPAVARWQDRLNPLQKVIGGGCHLNRPIGTLVREAGLAISEIDERYVARLPRFVGWFSSGRALST